MTCSSRPTERWARSRGNRVAARANMLNAAAQLMDVRSPPGNRLAALKGDRKGMNSIRVTDQSTIVFRWDDGDAQDVSIVDYH